MTGREVSVLSFVDGNTIKTMTSAQDHKRAGDGDTGDVYKRQRLYCFSWYPFLLC